jgi:UDP-4-amino-4,6-dideoxy-N-acetyl-beta-L-altrosamine N-acetyltransferase
MFNKLEFKLRKITEQDLELILQWRNSERVRVNMFTDKIITLEGHNAWFERIKSDTDNLYMIFEWEGIPIGVSSFTKINWEHRVCSWGFYLGESDLPSGMGTVMGYHSLEYAFEMLKIRKVTGEVFAFNVPSNKLFHKLGFICEGRLRAFMYKNGVLEDLILFGIFKDEWAKAKNERINTVFSEQIDS